jgi:hypothetical protein
MNLYLLCGKVTDADPIIFFVRADIMQNMLARAVRDPVEDLVP